VAENRSIYRVFFSSSPSLRLSRFRFSTSLAIFGRTSFRSDVLLALASAILCSFYLASIVRSGPAGDDFFRLQYRWISACDNQSWHQVLIRVVHASQKERGAVFPVSQAIAAAWLFLPGIVLAKILQLSLIAANFATFALVVARVTSSRSLALVAVSLTICAVELRKYHDPIIGTAFEMPLLVESMLLCLLLFILYQERKNIWLLLGAYAAYGCAVLSDQLAYSLIAIIGLFALKDGPQPRKMLAAIPFFLIACGSAIGVFLTHPAALASLNRDPSGLHSSWIYLRNALVQSIGAFPTSYRSLGSLIVVSDTAKSSAADTRFLKLPFPSRTEYLAPLLVALAAYFALVRRGWNLRALAADKKPLLILGLGMWVLPSLQLASSAVVSKLSLGEAVPAVYIQYFGVGATLAYFLGNGTRLSAGGSCRTSIASLVALTIFFVMYGNVRVNDFVINASDLVPAAITNLENAAKAGLFSRVVAGSVIVPDQSLPFANAQSGGVRAARYFLYGVARRRYRVASRRDVLPNGRFCRSEARGTCVPGGDDIWLLSNAYRTYPPSVTLARWYTTTNWAPQSIHAIRYIGFPNAAAAQADAHALSISASGMKRTIALAGGDSIVIDVYRQCGPTRVATIMNADSPELVWGHGFYPPEPVYRVPFVASAGLQYAPNQSWRFAGPQATLELRPGRCPMDLVDLKLAVFSSYPATLLASYVGKMHVLAVSETGTDFEIVARPHDGHGMIVRLSTNARRAYEIVPLPRSSSIGDWDIRMLVVESQLTARRAQKQ